MILIYAARRLNAEKSNIELIIQDICLLLCREDGLLDKTHLKDNIGQTFQNRGTVFSIQVQFQSDELERMQLLWAGHLRALGTSRTQLLGMPEKIDTVINQLNQWFLTI